MEIFQKLLTEKVSKEIEPVMRALGFVPVEVHVGMIKGQSLVSIIIYRSGGVGVDDCAQVSKLVYPKLELIQDLGNFSLEVSSPGIGRIFKSREEYNIFRGKSVSILRQGRSEWINGIIDCVDEEAVFLKSKGKQLVIKFDAIKKTKLENSLEEGKEHVL
jgi:ribosome maturation factor RimP